MQPVAMPSKSPNLTPYATLLPDTVSFYFQGKVVALRKPNPTQTVLQFLREERRATGTKEGCAEGDCGACTVVIAELDGRQNQPTLKFRALNACIQFLPTLAGKALFTVEDIAVLSKRVEGHPLQQAMIEQHGSQCGFCTPGFMMSLWAMYQENMTCPDTATVQAYLSGNLCRCTGYRPIIEAAKAAYQFEYNAPDIQPIIDILVTIQPSNISYTYGQQHYFAPATLTELARQREQYPEARLVAGSTDIGLWVTKQGRALGDMIYLGAVEDLKRIHHTPSTLDIGAMVPLAAAFNALIELHPHWAELARRFASKPIQNAGTLGGNIANGSPIGDSMAALMVLNAQLLLQKGQTERMVSLDEFYPDYQKNVLAPGEFIRAIRINTPLHADLINMTARHYFKTYKIAKRFEQDISAVSAAFYVVVDSQQHIIMARVAYGGMAGIVKRATYCEQALLHQPWTAETILHAQQVLTKDFTPLTDGRASARYRQQVAGNLLQRFYLENSAMENCLAQTDAPIMPYRLHDVIATVDISLYEDS